MTERTIRISSAALAIIAGTAITAYLLYVRASGSGLLCSTGGCEAVQSSRYSEIFGVPVAALGLGVYLVLLGTAIAPGETSRLVNAVVALAALAFSAYLLVVQLAVIGAVCDWCLASDAVTAALAALALLRLRTHSWNAASRSASSSTSARALRGRRANGSNRTRPSS